MSKYSVKDKYFRFICDASEWSFQLCRRFADSSQNTEDYTISQIDDWSYGVLEKTSKDVVYDAKVKLLV